ncbi:hypothetical protein N7530_012731 [Penicillium desertorum]|uniref:Uncharacterized protein n=1 Tax=Penicillium desertorum TaxID=1303715 RepID=A0A9W9WDI9_9EURO|nr:hypothetical protein N7530_012731 [Penicillium desertorum]
MSIDLQHHEEVSVLSLEAIIKLYITASHASNSTSRRVTHQTLHHGESRCARTLKTATVVASNSTSRRVTVCEELLTLGQTWAFMVLVRHSRKTTYATREPRLTGLQMKRTYLPSPPQPPQLGQGDAPQ